ncbi:hypothetical protein AZI85_07685 [Bdellovibrio bacteriovorus]|uniref:Uncharacterized protein n=1 Tax=Bdellovibrio bacteriovorus TaxID=959 RepID=A0A150WGJ9_BDEBC|nr:hypothetical protein AZI85_07685 [Bdellovibrio bacteriovorus]
MLDRRTAIQLRCEFWVGVPPTLGIGDCIDVDFPFLTIDSTRSFGILVLPFALGTLGENQICDQRLQVSIREKKANADKRYKSTATVAVTFDRFCSLIFKYQSLPTQKTDRNHICIKHSPQKFLAI